MVSMWMLVGDVEGGKEEFREENGTWKAGEEKSEGHTLVKVILLAGTGVGSALSLLAWIHSDGRAACLMKGFWYG